MKILISLLLFFIVCCANALTIDCCYYAKTKQEAEIGALIMVLSIDEDATIVNITTESKITQDGKQYWVSIIKINTTKYE
jgi:hypothetical protein